MKTTFRCYICDIETNSRARNIVSDMKSQHSRKPIAELLKRLQNGVGAIHARDGSNTCIVCDDCIDTINAYDEAFMLAEQVEKQLIEMIARTEEHYGSVKDGTRILRNAPINAIPMPKEPLLNPANVVADLFDSDEMQADQCSYFEAVNDADEVSISDPDEYIESEEEGIDSDDSFVWPKVSALKRKQAKEKGLPTGKKKPRIYSCIDCPADYHDKYEMQVITKHLLLLVCELK